MKKLLQEKLVQPILKARATRHEVGLGGAIGMFWALNPLVGIQMILVIINWFLFKLINIRFSSPIAVAMVWITNPVTMPFFYYGFYITGIYSFSLFGSELDHITFQTFEQVLQESLAMDTWGGLIYWVNFMIVELGLPMLLGGVIIALPVSVFSYFLIYRLLTRIRQQKAKKENLTLEAWEANFLKQD